MSESVDPAVPGSIVEPAAGAPSVLVVDADERTRESVVGILGIRHRYRVVGSADGPIPALALLRQHRPDVVIVDPRLPEPADGMTLIRRIRTIDPGIHILAVGLAPELEAASIEAGAHTFVRKTFKPGDLSGAITRCLDAEAGPLQAPGAIL